MRKCENCSAEIPSTVVVDGKRRNLKNRKFCFDCSPFGQHNTRNVTKHQTANETCVCLTCTKTFLYKRKGQTRTKCGSCFVSECRRKLKQKCVDYKGGKCEVCGYKKYVGALEFHHLDETKKDFNISNSRIRKWSLVVVELEKCVMLCANCHREAHSKLREC